MKHLSSLLRGGLSAAFLILIMLAGPAARAQAPAWQTAVAVATTAGSESVVQFTAANATGDLYLTGIFKGTVAFGTTSLTSAGSSYYDVFVAKWSPATGRFVWALRAGSTADDFPTAVAVSGAGLYVGGGFLGAAAFGSTVLPGNGGTADVSFLTRVNDAGSTGTFAWAQQFTGFTGLVTGLAAQGPALYLTGDFQGTASFGATTLLAAGSSDVFVAKLTDTGTGAGFVWAQQAGGPDYDSPSALAVSGTSVYATGSFGGTASFGPTSLVSAGSSDVFVTKLTDAGTTSAFAWTQRAGGASYDYSNAMAVSGTGVYLAGEFGSAVAAFGPATLTNARSGFSDAFVAKLTDAGPSAAFAWAQRAGGPDYDIAHGIAVSGSSVYLSGEFLSATASFGPTTLTNANGSRLTADVFVAKLTDAGTSAAFTWMQQAGGTGDDACGPLLLAGTSVYVAGYASAPATFGSLVLSSPTTNLVGYLASLTDPTLTATATAQSGLAFTLAPNPARTAATLTLPALPGTATATLILRDALGRALRTETVPLPAAGLRHALDLAGLAPGLYAVQVRAGSTVGTQRLVVE